MKKLLPLLVVILFAFSAKAQVRIEQLRSKAQDTSGYLYVQPDHKVHLDKRILADTAYVHNYHSSHTPPASTDDQQISLDTTTNILTLEDGGTVDLTPYLDNTDDQQITAFDYNTTTNVLTITLEDGGTKTVDLSSLNTPVHTGTSGSVFFAGSDGKPTEDNSSLFWDAAKKILKSKRFRGIGTSATAGTVALDVKYAGDNVLNTFGSAFGGYTFLGYACKSEGSYDFQSTAGNLTSSRGAILLNGEIAFKTAPAQQVAIDGLLSNMTTKVIIKNDGRVGIGTEYPSSTLHIKDTTNDGSTSSFLVQNSAGSSLFRVLSSGYTVFHAGVNNDTKIATNGMFITADINFFKSGINSYLNVYDVNNDRKLWLYNSATGKNVHLVVDGTGSFGGTVSGADAVNANEFVTKGQLDASTYWTKTGNNIAYSNGNIKVNAIEGNSSGIFHLYSKGDFVFHLDNDDNNLSAYNIVNGTNNNIFHLKEDGKLGLGTTTPESDLHVKSAGNANIYVERNSGAKVTLISQADKGVVGTASNHPFSLRVNNADRMTVLTSGFVGIGTTTPTYLLDVNGNARFNGKVKGQEATAADEFVTKAQLDAASMSGFWTQNGNDISNSNFGNVGIKTNTPTVALEVNGAIKGKRIVLDSVDNQGDHLTATMTISPSSNSGGGTYLDIETNSGGVNLYGALAIRLNNANAQTWIDALGITKINSTGNTSYSLTDAKSVFNTDVGIGISNPTQKLDVAGKLKTDAIHLNTLAVNAEASASAQIWEKQDYGLFYRQRAVVTAPTVGTSTTNNYVKAASSFTLSTGFRYDGEIGYIFNAAGADITIYLAGSGHQWVDKGVNSATITVAPNETVTWIFDEGTGDFRILNRY